MNNELAALLDPKKRSDTERQQAVEKLVFSLNKPDPEIWKTIIPLIENEPVSWIQQLEARVLKRLPYGIEFMTAVLPLVESSSKTVRSEAADIIAQVAGRLALEKNYEGLKDFETHLLTPLVEQLKRENIAAEQSTWSELYKTLSFLSDSPPVTEALVELLPKGGDNALLLFAQYLQGKSPESCLETLLSGFSKSKSDDTSIHVLRTLTVALPKGGEPSGFATTEPMIRVLLAGLQSKSENVRRETINVLTTRAKAAVKLGKPLPLEDELWNALFTLYSSKITDPYARDKDVANVAIAALPINQERLLRLFELMHSIEDGMEKQSLVGLIGSFKTEESRNELLKLLRENFAGLRLEAQKVTVECASKYLPDEEVEVELDKLLGGRGLHSDILAKLGDKLFAPLPSLKARLMKWLSLNEKTQRPIMEQFPLPMMHTKVILASKKLATDPDIHALLLTLEPLLMMNDAQVRLHDILKNSSPSS